jgi:uncharacterized NAD(P)/FAD-binding protein YdhS
MAAKTDKIQDLVIVGTGLAGTITFVQELLKIAAEPSITAANPVKITLLERNEAQKFGGVAYGRTAEFDQFRLNLSAKRATPFMADDIPEGFPTFPEYILGLADKAHGKDDKQRMLGYLQDPPRVLLGDYLSHLVDLAVDKAAGKVQVQTRIGEALELDTDGAQPVLSVKENGKMTTIEAAQVVLATGQREIQRPDFVAGLAGSSLYLEDPYSAGSKDFYTTALAEQARRDKAGLPPVAILILGTALSSQDSALRLLQLGYKGKITMISRNGLEHAGYGAVTTEEYLAHSLTGEPRPEKKKELEAAPPRFLRIVKAQAELIAAGKPHEDVERDVVTSMRREFAVLMRRGYTPEEVLGYWERFNTDMGAALPDDVCAGIYNRHASWLGTHRVGTTPENTRIIEEAKKSGQLEVLAGFISTKDGETIHEHKGKVVVHMALKDRVARAGGGHGGDVPREWDSAFSEDMREEARKFDFVISGLGNTVTYDKARDPFWAGMIRKGLCQPHKKAGDGIELDGSDLTLIDAEGRRVENVAACGIPAFGATMYGRFPHPEEPGVYGGRILPFTANIVGITGGVIAMVQGLHERLMAGRGLEREATLEAPEVYSSPCALSEIERGELGATFGDAQQRDAAKKSGVSAEPLPQRPNELKK